jgi:hypothetical protein
MEELALGEMEVMVMGEVETAATAVLGSEGTGKEALGAMVMGEVGTAATAVVGLEATEEALGAMELVVMGIVVVGSEGTEEEALGAMVMGEVGTAATVVVGLEATEEALGAMELVVMELAVVEQVVVGSAIEVVGSAVADVEAALVKVAAWEVAVAAGWAVQEEGTEPSCRCSRHPCDNIHLSSTRRHAHNRHSPFMRQAALAYRRSHRWSGHTAMQHTARHGAAGMKAAAEPVIGELVQPVSGDDINCDPEERCRWAHHYDGVSHVEVGVGTRSSHHESGEGRWDRCCGEASRRTHCPISKPAHCQQTRWT